LKAPPFPHSHHQHSTSWLSNTAVFLLSSNNILVFCQLSLIYER